jgi:hypothetical protein
MDAQDCHKCRLGRGILNSTRYVMEHVPGDHPGSREDVPIARVESWRCAVCGHQWELNFAANGASAE